MSPESGRLQINDWREGQLSVGLPILSVPEMGKHVPVKSTCDSRVFQRSCQEVIQKPLKRYIKRVYL